MSKDGIAKGDLVAISLGSRVEYFETFFACTYLGAALVLLNYAYAQSEMLALLNIVSMYTPVKTNREEWSVHLLTVMNDRAEDVGHFFRIRMVRQHESPAQDRG
jgi:acyl-CoA synthetase (AMP-forming)/AMP-acid ligase II